MSATNVTSKFRIARIEPDDPMMLAHIANLDGSPFRKGHGPCGRKKLVPAAGKTVDHDPNWRPASHAGEAIP
jgi:hypothetical protein